ncbi:MAG: hypothetical protein Q8P41_08635 [Pseudomonadota bacterium]|nr:hypothetical protein [Pseudomonadota bacterium]
MSDLDTSLDALAFFRSWKSTFLLAVDSAATSARAADEALARAERLVGRLPEGSAPDSVVGQADALAALEGEVALLEAFEAGKARYDTWLGWIARATPGGPLTEWRTEAMQSRAALERQLAEADPAALPEVRAELDRQLGGVAALVDATRTRLQEARAQVKTAVDTFEQAVRILLEDVHRMEETIDELRALAAGVEREGLVPIFGIGAIAGAVGGVVGWSLGGESAGAWSMGAGGGALVIGLCVGLARWSQELDGVQARIAALQGQARDLGADLDGARATVLSELAASTAAWEAAAADAAELRFDPGRLDTGPATAKVREPAVSLPLDGLRARLAALQVSRRGWRVAAGSVAGVALAVTLVVAFVLQGPPTEAPTTAEATSEATAEAPAEAPATPEVPAVAGGAPDTLPAASGQRVVTAGAGASTGSPVGAPPTQPDAPPPTLAAGAWAGTMGLATVVGTLAQDGEALSGTFTLSEGGAPRVCTAKGTTSAGNRVRVTLKGCGTPIRLEGVIREGGRTLSGRSRSIGTGNFAGAEIVDAFELNAR